MPKARIVDVGALIAALLNNKDSIIDSQTGKIQTPTNTCWIKIEKELKNAVNAKYIYTVVKVNRYNSHNILGIGINTEDPTYLSQTLTEEDYSKDLSSSSLETENVLHFNITLSTEEWKQMYLPQESMFKRSDGKINIRAYFTLTPHLWTTLVNEHFFEQTRLSCKITYKRAKIYPNGMIFLDIIGYCTTCMSNFKGTVDSVPDPNTRVIINCTMTGNYLHCQNRNKRRNVGKKEYYVQKLVNENMSAAYLQRVEAERFMKYGESEPSHLPSMNALRVMKCKTLQSEHTHPDSIINIQLLKGLNPFSKIIRDIGCDRFFVHYWTVNELRSYRLYHKNTTHPTISIDATGGVVRKISLVSGRETANIFLYQIAVMDYKSKCQFSVAHMLSERHDNNSIGHWLVEWQRSTLVTTPKIVVTDQSLALMMAVVKTFTQYATLNTYLRVCSALIIGTTEVEIPTCMVRNDFNHVMHLFSSWSEMKSATFRVKNFYLRSFGLLVCSTQFEDIKLLLRYIFTAALHETDGFNFNNLPTDCENAKKYLKHRIATYNLNMSFDEQQTEQGLYNITFEMEEGLNDDDKLISEDDELISENSTQHLQITIFDQIKIIYQDCIIDAKEELKSSGDHDNMQYNPSIAKKLMEFCKLIPCWSAVMVPIFNCGKITETSSSSESLFNDLKRNVFKHKTLPLRVEDFIKIHIHSIVGATNIQSAKSQNVKNDRENTFVEKTTHGSLELQVIQCSDEVIIDTEKQTHIENWKGLGKKNKKRKRNYLDKDPNILLYNDNSKTKCPVIGLLKNGNVSELRSVAIEGKHYSLINTCTFDSISYILMTAVADSQNYCSWVKENSISSILFEMISNSLRDGITVQTYRKRAKILIDLFATQLVENPGQIISVDTSSTAYFMVNKLFSNYPSCTELQSCNACSASACNNVSAIAANLPNHNLIQLQDVLENKFEKQKLMCQNCKIQSSEVMYSLQPHLFIELCVPFTESCKISSNLDLSVVLNEIPVRLILLEKTYYLRGLINFIPPVSNNPTAIGHYVAYSWREHNNYWERYDDLQSSIKTARQNTIAKNCQFLLHTL